MKNIKWFAGIFIISISMLVATSVQAAFSDIPSSHQFKNEVDHLVELGAIGGYPDGTYRAGNNVTRGQAAKILTVALRMPLINPATPTFKDVPKSNDFYQHIETLAAKGIIGGYPDGTFKGGNSLTRAQMAKILSNSFDLDERSYVTFKDVDRHADYYLFVDRLATSKITTGYPDNTFKPAGIVTRGQIAAFVSRGIHGYDKSMYDYRDVYLEMSKAQVRVVEGIPSSETENTLVYDYVEGDPLNAKITYHFFYGKLDIMEFDFDLSHVPTTRAESEAFFKDIFNTTYKPYFGTPYNELDRWMHTDHTKALMYGFWFTPQSNRIELQFDVKEQANMNLRVVR